MNTNVHWLAERTVTGLSRSGERLDVTLRIGAPYEVAEQEWACPLETEGLRGGMQLVRGIDAWQALQLALSLQARTVGHFLDDGGRLFWHDTSYSIELRELFPAVPPAPE